MEYVKTFVLLAVFIFFSVTCIANIIIHRDEKKEKRLLEKEAKREAKAEKRAEKRARRGKL